MKLSEYLASAEGGVTALARKAQVGRITIYRTLRHGRLSFRTVAERISIATGGAVSVAELLGIEPPQATGKGAPRRRSATRARKAT